MMMNRIGDTKVVFPIIFPDKMVHSQVYEVAKKIMPGWRPGFGVKAVSAGSIEHLEVHGLHGSSETLGIASRPEDASVIDSYSYTHGIL